MPMTTDYMVTKDLNSRLIDITLGEALELVKPFLAELISRAVQDNLAGKGKDEYGHGLKAIQEVFDCCPTKAVQIHNDKRYASAIYDDGKKIVVNKTRLYQLMEEEKKKQLRLE